MRYSFFGKICCCFSFLNKYNKFYDIFKHFITLTSKIEICGGTLTPPYKKIKKKNKIKANISLQNEWKFHPKHFWVNINLKEAIIECVWKNKFLIFL